MTTLEQWKRDEAAVFEGWDFSYIAGRSHQDEPPWSYRDRAAALVRAGGRLLDVDTGGGEFLASLAPLPTGAAAIESYPPNVEVARGRLAAHGVRVVGVAVGASWPFQDGAFDLLLNRQGHLHAPETSRCLAPGGVFLTQQVGSDNLAGLAAVFGEPPATLDNSRAGVSAELGAAGLVITEAQTWTGRQTFSDVGALVYFLRAVPWVVPGFSVETHRAVLERLQGRLDAGEPLSFGISRFLIEARKPAG